MSWIDTDYEKSLRSYFIEKLGDIEGRELYSRYESIRNEMQNDNFFNHIQGSEPNLSDHSERHIRDVFRISYKVLGEDIKQLDCHEAYCYALMVLLHDVGNIHGRKGHNDPRKIAEIYNKYRANSDNFSQEKRVVAKGASAHTGIAKDGSRDTLKFLEEDQLNGEKIDLVKLAALLRFSDELAEGKHRTCSYMIENDLFDEDSEIYHIYAKSTEIAVDKPGQRIAITYNISIGGSLDENEREKLKKILNFTFLRAVKLDIERRYTKHYSYLLSDFKKVVVRYNFINEGVPLFGLNLDELVFEDNYPVPGSEEPEKVNDIIKKKNPSFELDNLLDIIEQEVNS